MELLLLGLTRRFEKDWMSNDSVLEPRNHPLICSSTVINCLKVTN